MEREYEGQRVCLWATKMIAQYNCSGDWAFYLEADEIIHEKEYDVIKNAMERHFDNTEVEALYFNFYHFYGIPNQVGIAGYRQAPRIIRNSLRTIAPDGLFWVVLDDNKEDGIRTRCMPAGTFITMGIAEAPSKMAEKLKQIGKYWNSDHQPFEGYGNIDLAELRPFRGTHPAVMKQWLESEAEIPLVKVLIQTNHAWTYEIELDSLLKRCLALK